MKEKEILSAIESILFVYGEPITIRELSKAMGLTKVETHRYVQKLKTHLEIGDRGIRIIQINEKYQMTTKRENYIYIEKLCTSSASKGLSQPTLEVLSIIAYKQPITKNDIELVRGVKCDKAISTLIEHELIEMQGRLERIGRPKIYGTTDTFLRCFGFRSLEELPKIQEFEKIELLFKEHVT